MTAAGCLSVAAEGKRPAVMGVWVGRLRALLLAGVAASFTSVRVRWMGLRRNEIGRTRS